MPKNYDHLRPTLKMALEKLSAFCAYQERCQADAIEKLKEMKLDEEDVAQVLSLLISEGFINEERYAKTYARGKFSINKWGKVKIKEGLKRKKISEYCIKKGIEQIDDKAYMAILKELIERKKNTIKDKNQWIRKKKLLNYALQKGFEYELIMRLI